jgi:hypothetical protein
VKDKTHLKFIIPRGDYCYSFTGRLRISNQYIDCDGELKETDRYFSIPETRTCPFWAGKQSEGKALCTYLQKEGDLIWDQIKECGENVREHETYLESQEYYLRNYPKRTPRDEDSDFLEKIARIINISGQDFATIDGVDYVLSENLKVYI